MRAILARFRLPLGMVLLAFALGTLGYWALEGWAFLDALYMTVITLTTVGFQEVHPLDTSGRVLTISVLVIGVGAVFAMVTIGAELLASGELVETLRRRRMGRRLQDLRGHFIVCAFGRVGRAAVDELMRHGEQVMVLDVDTELEPRLAKLGVPYLMADPSEEDVLKEAGIERAKGLICAVDSDSINVFITLTARALNPEMTIVARASHPDAGSKLERAGADRVVLPYAISGTRMATVALRPNVVDFLDMVRIAGHLRLEEILVRERSRIAGSTISELQERYPQAAVVAVRKATSEIAAPPPSTTRLTPGDMAIVLGPTDDLDRMAE